MSYCGASRIFIMAMGTFLTGAWYGQTATFFMALHSLAGPQTMALFTLSAPCRFRHFDCPSLYQALRIKFDSPPLRASNTMCCGQPIYSPGQMWEQLRHQ